MTLKKNILIISGGLAAVLMVMLSGFLLYRGKIQLQEADERLEESKNALVDLHKSNPFPSRDNVETEKRNVAELRSSFGKLMTELREGEVQPIANITPSTFMDLLYAKRSEMIDQAKQSGTILPANFAFGFDRYCDKDSKLPPPDELPLLSQQLIVVETLSDIIFREKAKEIIKITKDDVDVKSGQAGVVNVSADKKQRQLFSKLHFVIDFKAKESALLGILNNISTSKMFMVISCIKLEKDGPDVLDAAKPKSHEENEPKLADLAPPRGTGVVTRTAAMAVSREDRMACGVSIEKPMKVRLTVDAYKFNVE